MFKWLDCKAKLTACDPDPDALEEAKRRCGSKPVKFYSGDIHSTPVNLYDVICYNFSFHYTFDSEKCFVDTVNSICERSKPGTKFIGIVPDSGFILHHMRYTDVAGNYFMRNPETTGNGSFGEKIWVCVKDTLYYENDEPIAEPIAYKDLMITEFESRGWTLDEWQSIVPHATGFITDMYSRFIFTRIE